MKQQAYSWEQAVNASYRALQDEKKCLIDIGLTSKMFGEVPESSLKRLEAVRERIRGWKQWFSIPSHYPLPNKANQNVL